MQAVATVLVAAALLLAYATPAVYWWAERPHRRWAAWQAVLLVASLGMSAVVFAGESGLFTRVSVAIATLPALAISVGVLIWETRRLGRGG
jgi:heme A synthase